MPNNNTHDLPTLNLVYLNAVLQNVHPHKELLHGGYLALHNKLQPCHWSDINSPDHDYAMATSIEEDINHYKYINLRNPHMGDSVDYDAPDPATHKRERITKPGAEKGKLRMELNDFIKYFGYYEIGKVKKEI